LQVPNETLFNHSKFASSNYAFERKQDTIQSYNVIENSTGAKEYSLQYFDISNSRNGGQSESKALIILEIFIKRSMESRFSRSSLLARMSPQASGITKNA